MTLTLSDELRQALSEQVDRPIEVIDPGTNLAYILISREQYDRLRPLFEEVPVTAEEQRNLLRDAGRRAGWDDPVMDAYDRYDEARSQQP